MSTREEQLEKKRLESREYYAKNKERIRQYRCDNAEKQKEQSKRSYDKHREQRKADCKKFYWDNRDDRLEVSRKAYENDRENRIQYEKDRRDRIKKDVELNGLSLPDILKQKCKSCQEVLPINNFGVLITKNSYQPICKPCRNEMGRVYRIDNAEEISERRRNSKTILSADRKLLINLRKRLVHCVNGIDTSKTSLALELLGCDRKSFFKEWLMFNLELDNMSFDRYGNSFEDGWHMDHVIPCASFPSIENVEQQKLCFHWSNIKPLHRIVNLSKGDKIIPKILFEQELRLRIFVKRYPEYLDRVLTTANLMRIKLQQQV